MPALLGDVVRELETVHGDLGICILDTAIVFAEPLRRALILSELGGLSYKEIAEVTKIREGTVGSRRHRALAELKERLEATGVRRLNVERKAIFRELEPPPGGAARLRAKLRSAAQPQVVRVWRLGPIAVAVVAAVTVFAFRFVPVAQAPEPDSLMTAAAFDRLLGRPSEPYELVVRRGSERLSVREPETRDPTVRVFRIDGASPDDDATDNASR